MVQGLTIDGSCVADREKKHVFRPEIKELNLTYRSVAQSYGQRAKCGNSF